MALQLTKGMQTETKMFKNYFITAFRNIKREKVYAFLNITGLALGIGCALVIYKVWSFELSYDTHHEKHEDIYRVVREKLTAVETQYETGVPHPFGQALRNDFPDFRIALTHYNGNTQVSSKRADGNIIRFSEEGGVVFAEPDILDILTFDFLAGSPAQSLREPGSAVISRSWAQKYFELSEENIEWAVGKSLALENAINLTVTAVIEDPPLQTDLPFQLMVYYPELGKINDYFREGKDWEVNSSETNCYVLIESENQVTSLLEQFPAFIDKYRGANTSDRDHYYLQRLSEVHFDPRFGNFQERVASWDRLYILAVIGIFLIVSAVINFINLTTAQATNRSKEIGVRKTLGGNKIQLITQFLSETLLISIVAGLLSLIISEMLLLHLRSLIDLEIYLNLISEPDTLLFLVGLIIFVGLFSGFYPAFILSRMDAVLALRTKFSSGSGPGLLSFRRVLVIVQFSISQMLIISTLIVGSQLDYFTSKELGFETDAIITTGLPENEPQKLRRLRSKLSEIGGVEGVSFNLSAPLGNSNAHSNIHHHTVSSDDNVRVNFKVVDEEYFNLYGLEVIAGRALDKKDAAGAVLINRKLSRMLGTDNPSDVLGDKLSVWGAESRVIGVVEDFHTRSLRDDMDLVVIGYDPRIFYELAVKLDIENKDIGGIQNLIRQVGDEWQGVFPEYIFEYEFYDEQLAERYEQEARLGQLFQLFSIIAILIGCLGLYGLIAYVANKKTKEIGVRKVLGASVWSILGMFSKEMLVLVIVAFCIAGPLGFYFMDEWLSDFSYRVDMPLSYFIWALIASMGIALLTISYRTILAATANPIAWLKDE